MMKSETRRHDFENQLSCLNVQQNCDANWNITGYQFTSSVINYQHSIEKKLTHQIIQWLLACFFSITKERQAYDIFCMCECQPVPTTVTSETSWNTLSQNSIHTSCHYWPSHTTPLPTTTFVFWFSPSSSSWQSGPPGDLFQPHSSSSLLTNQISKFLSLLLSILLTWKINLVCWYKIWPNMDFIFNYFNMPSNILSLSTLSFRRPTTVGCNVQLKSQSCMKMSPRTCKVMVDI